MDDGAFVLVDCLGFRGIWSRIEARQLSDKLKELETIANARIIRIHSASQLSFGPIRFHLRFLSDTIALSVQYEPAAGRSPDQRQLNLLVSVACESAASLAGLFIDNETASFPLRGCISFGPHLCSDNYLIGPAVDEAAEYMTEPEGAFIWVLPSAAAGHRDFVQRSASMLRELPDESLKKVLDYVASLGVPGMSWTSPPCL